jgi:hypothetical protein
LYRSAGGLTTKSASFSTPKSRPAGGPIPYLFDTPVYFHTPRRPLFPEGIVPDGPNINSALGASFVSNTALTIGHPISPVPTSSKVRTGYLMAKIRNLVKEE